jgi:hypothetical protein
MLLSRFLSLSSQATISLLVLAFFSLINTSLAAKSNVTLIQGTNANGVTTWLRDNRTPALYTGDFGDCLGSSLINVTRFDAGYYADNMTVLFHLQGNTNLNNESVMLYIGVYACKFWFVNL